jgi:hypothetical protein
MKQSLLKYIDLLYPSTQFTELSGTLIICWLHYETKLTFQTLPHCNINILDQAEMLVHIHKFKHVLAEAYQPLSKLN